MVAIACVGSYASRQAENPNGYAIVTAPAVDATPHRLLPASLTSSRTMSSSVAQDHCTNPLRALPAATARFVARRSHTRPAAGVTRSICILMLLTIQKASSLRGTRSLKSVYRGLTPGTTFRGNKQGRGIGGVLELD
jgi:hypothetical protein